MSNSNYIILFDGDCLLCSKAVHFIIKNDKDRKFKFAALSSDYAHKFLFSREIIEVDFNSIVYVEQKEVYYKSTAVLKIARRLNGFWPFFFTLMLVPRVIRDYFYDLIAKWRYKLVKSDEVCGLLESIDKDRFIS